MDNNGLPYVIIQGSPVDGITIMGPYPTATAAIDVAETLSDSWWIAPLYPSED